MLTYCDYIAYLIHTYIKPHDMQGLIQSVGRVEWALDADGALSGTDKTIVVTDIHGQRYRVTVEALELIVREELVDGTSEAFKSLTIV